MSFRTVGRCRRLPGTAVRGVLCLALLFLASCQEQPAYKPPPPPKVTVSQPVRQNVTDYLELTGNTQAVNTVQLRARVEGFLDKVFFKDGDMVKKDQLLFLIQQDTYLARLKQTEGTVLSQKALLKHAATELERYTSLYKQKAAAQTDVENWQYQLEAAQAAIMTAEAQRDQARLDFGYTWVTAPFDGRIDRRQVDPGNLVGLGESTVLAQLTQMNPLYVYFNVSERDLSSLILKRTEAPGRGEASRVPVYIGLANDEGYPHEGYLDFSASSLTTTTGTLLVRGVFSNSDGMMRPGQFARARVPRGKERSALLIPRGAVSFDELGSYVLVVNEKNVIERRNVKTGALQDGMEEIQEGLGGSEQVVVKGILKAIPGRQVTPEREEAGRQPSSGVGPGASPNAQQG